MPVPDRPVSGASIESVWGQDIHDRTFSPKGCFVHGAAATTIASTATGLDLDTANEDPGGWLGGPIPGETLEVPTGAEGLYVLSASYDVAGVDSQFVYISYALNGSFAGAITVAAKSSVTMQGIISAQELLSAGDVLSTQAFKITVTGSACTVRCKSFKLARIGHEYGA